MEKNEFKVNFSEGKVLKSPSKWYIYLAILIKKTSRYTLILCICINFCSDSADKVVKGEGKYEELVVCSQEIAASTTQLVVSSKVKADRKSTNLQPLSEASKRVTEATAQVVASAKSAAQAIDDIGRL